MNQKVNPEIISEKSDLWENVGDQDTTTTRNED